MVMLRKVKFYKHVFLSPNVFNFAQPGSDLAANLIYSPSDDYVCLD